MEKLCALSGCTKSAHPGHQCCGRHHHYLYMASLLGCSDITVGTRSGRCSLPCCPAPAREGYDYCGRTHALQDLSRVAASPQWRQCKWEGCTRPVYVDQTGCVGEFCGLRHAQLYSMKQPKVLIGDNKLAEQVLLINKNGDPSSTSSIQHMEDFFTKDPAEIFSSCETFRYIVTKKKSSSNSSRSKKSSGIWKQQGPAYKDGCHPDVKKANKTYKYKQDNNCEFKFTMVEFSTEDGPWVVGRVNKKAADDEEGLSRRKRRKEEAGETMELNEQAVEAAEVDSILQELPIPEDMVMFQGIS